MKRSKLLTIVLGQGSGGGAAQPPDGASFDTWLPTARPLNEVTVGNFDTWLSNTVPLDRSK